MAAAFWAHAGVMVTCGIAPGSLGRARSDWTRGWRLSQRLPGSNLAAAAVGQNAPLGLLLAMIAINGLRGSRQIVAGLAVGAMLYKPTLALRCWSCLSSDASGPRFRGHGGRRRVVPAGRGRSAGDWMWPKDWLIFTSPYFDADTWQNVNKTIRFRAF